MDIQGSFTKKGLLLAAKLAAGSTLNITRVCAGAAETAMNASSLSQIRQTLSVGAARRSDETAVLPVTLEAGMAGSAYTLRELGVYAQDPDEGEILYKVYRLSEPVEISPASRLVLRFYLEETVSQDLNVTVVRSSAGLLTEADLDPVRRKVEAVSVPSRTVELEVSELPAFLASLPRLLTEDLVLQVTGTLDEPLTISNFYGPGSIRIVAGTDTNGTLGAAVFRKPVDTSNCQTPIQFWSCLFQKTEAGENASHLLRVTRNATVRAYNCEFAGNAAHNLDGVSATYWANVMVESCKIHGCKYAVYASRNSFIFVSGSSANFYGNDVGAYTWRGGIVQLGNITPVLGGVTNQNDGGTIIKGNQFVSNNGSLT